MGCFESKNNKYKAKPFKIVNTSEGQFNSRWKRLLQIPNISQFIVSDCNGVAEHPAFRAIQKDVERTFPNHKNFKNTQNIHTFKQVLKCYALTFPTIGYTQGLNFVAGYFLIHKASKNQCLNFLVSLSSHPQLLCLGLYEDGFPLTQLYCQIFWILLQKIDKQLYDCLKVIDIPDHMWIFQWYLTLFLYSFPFEYIAFFFNYLFEYKQFGSVKLSLGIVLSLRQQIMNLPQKDDVGFIQFLQNLKNIESCLKIFSFQAAVQRAHQIPDKMVTQSLQQLNKESIIKNFYIKYFSAKSEQRKILYDLFISQIKEKTEQLTSSRYDNKLMQTYKRSRQTVEILDQILVQSIKRQKNKKCKSNMIQMRKTEPKSNLNFKKWKSLFQVNQDFKIEDETNVSIVRRVIIPEDKDQ